MLAHTDTAGCTGISVFITSDGLKLCTLREIKGDMWSMHHRIPSKQPIFVRVYSVPMLSPNMSPLVYVCANVDARDDLDSGRQGMITMR